MLLSGDLQNQVSEEERQDFSIEVYSGGNKQSRSFSINTVKFDPRNEVKFVTPS